MEKIFGYDWENIQQVQQKHGRLAAKIDTSKPATDDTKYLDTDKKLLEQHGAEKLRELGYFGVIDRLRRCGLLQPTTKKV